MSAPGTSNRYFKFEIIYEDLSSCDLLVGLNFEHIAPTF